MTKVAHIAPLEEKRARQRGMQLSKYEITADSACNSQCYKIQHIHNGSMYLHIHRAAWEAKKTHRDKGALERQQIKRCPTLEKEQKASSSKHPRG